MSIEDCIVPSLAVDGELVISFSAPDIAPKLNSITSNNLGIILNLISIEPHSFKLDLPAAKIGRELFPEPIICSTTITQSGEITPIPWTNVSVVCSSSVPTIANSGFIVYPAVFLANATYPTFITFTAESLVTQNIEFSSLSLGNTLVNGSLNTASNSSSGAVLGALLTSDTHAFTLGVSEAYLSLNALDVSSERIASKLSLNDVEFLTNYTLGSISLACRMTAFGSAPLLDPLELHQLTPTVTFTGRHNTPEIGVIRTIILNSGSSSAVSGTAARLATSFSDIDYPFTVQDQVRYPLATATSIATPYVDGTPVNYAHGVFGAAVNVVNHQASTATSLSAVLHSTVNLPSTDSYPADSIKLHGLIAMFRVSNQDTANVRKSAIGYMPFGDDVTRVATDLTNFPLTYSGSVANMTPNGHGTLAEGVAVTDSRTISNTSLNKRLLIASSLVRHNFDTADATTIPISAATDFNYPTAHPQRLTRARLETTVNPDDEAGLGAVYSTTHLGIVSDTEFAARNTAQALFKFNATLLNTFGTAAIPAQHVHSSDSMFAFLPIKPGVRYKFDKNFTTVNGSYSVESAEFVSTSTGPKFCVVLSGSPDPIDYNLPLKIRIEITSYRNDINRKVIVDVPVIEKYQGKLVIDSSYRWYVQQVASGGQFVLNSNISIAIDQTSSEWSVGPASLIVLRPNTALVAMPEAEWGGGDAGESQQALLALPEDRNFILGEFSISAKRPTITDTGSVRVNQDLNQSTQIYSSAVPNKQAASLSSFDPETLHLIVDIDGDLKGEFDQFKNDERVLSSDIDCILPAAVKVYRNQGGKFSKVVVGENAIGLLTVPTSEDTGRKLFVWGSNIYGHLVPPDITSTTYATFVKDGYIENIKDFDIATAYMCAITDAGTLHCWGCRLASEDNNTAKSSWTAGADGQSTNFYLDGAIGNQHLVVKQQTATNNPVIKQYGNISQNVPFIDGWSTATKNSIACGAAHVVALRANGTVVCWGDNAYGQLTVPPGLTNIVAVAAGDDHSVALKNDGTIYAWGRNHKNQCAIQSQSGLKAKAIFAAGNYSGCIRSSAAADITVTDADYSDVEDTVFVIGDNEHFINAIPVCEGKSYDPSYPRYRMKFHEVIAGWDHAVGIRKVEAELAYRIHPEICEYVNSPLAAAVFKTSTNQIIFDNINDIDRQDLTFVSDSSNPSDLNKYYPNADGKTVGADKYRIVQGVISGCESSRYKIQKFTTTWQDVQFNLRGIDVNGTDLTDIPSSADIGGARPFWYSATNGLPEWRFGFGEPDLVSCNYLSSGNIQQIEILSVAGTGGEQLSFDMISAKVYGAADTDQSIICWGNPLGYYTGYRRDQYADYGVPSTALTGDFSDLDIIDGYITPVAASPKIQKINGFQEFSKSPQINKTHSYMGRLGLATTLNLQSAGYIGTISNIYIGSCTAYPIPVNNTVGALYSPLIVRTSQVSSSHPESGILNCPLPIATYGATAPIVHSYLIHGALDVYSFEFANLYLGAAQNAFKSLKVTNSTSALNTTLVATDKWLVLGDQDSRITEYSWGSSPTGFWYVYNNAAGNSSPNTLLSSRYYNFTGMYATSTTHTVEADDVYLPYDHIHYESALTAAQLTSLGLGVRRYYMVKHQTDKHWVPNQAESEVRAGKHLTTLPTSRLFNPNLGLNLNLYGTTIQSSDTYSPLGWMKNFSTSGLHKVFVGYRSIYALRRSKDRAFVNPEIYRYLIAQPQGSNLHGQLNTPEHYEALKISAPFGSSLPYLSSESLRSYNSSWFMDLGQTAGATPAAGQTFTKVSCGQYHALALDSRGKIYAWGSNTRIEPGALKIVDWNPGLPYLVDDAGQSLYYQHFYTSNFDIFRSTATWGNNYVPSGVFGGVPNTLTPLTSNSWLLPYPDSIDANASALDNGTFAVKSATFWSEDFPSAGFDQCNEIIDSNSLRNGGFTIKLVSDGTGDRVELSTGLNEPKLYSNYINSNTPIKLFSWNYDYSSKLGLHFEARVNGVNVNWGDQQQSSPLSFRDPELAAGIIGTSITYPFGSLKLSKDKIANNKIAGVVGGKNFVGVIVEPNAGDTLGKKTLVPALNASVNGLSGEFENIAVGSYFDAFDVVLQRKIRNFDVVNPTTHSTGSIYSSTTPAVAIYAQTPYKIYIEIQNDALLVDADPVNYSDQIDNLTGSNFGQKWPRVVFPGEPNYNSSTAYPPERVGLFRYPNVNYSTSDFFNLVKLRDPAALPQPDSATYDIDFYAMYYPGGDGFAGTVVYDSVTKKVIPQRYTPKAASVPAPICIDVMSSKRTGFASSALNLHSWGQNWNRSRSYNVPSTYDTLAVTLPGGLHSLTCLPADNVFRAAGLSALGEIYLWGQQSISLGSDFYYGAQNKAFTTFSIGGTQTPVTGFKKIALFKTEGFNTEYYFGIDATDKLKFFKLVKTSVEDAPLPKYIKYLDYDPADGGFVYAYRIPDSLVNLNFKDVVVGINYVLALTVDGKVHCWGENGPSPSTNYVASAFVDFCHECAQNANANTTPSTTQPSPKMKINEGSFAAVDIAALQGHAAALLANGQVIIWGFLSQFSTTSGSASTLSQNNPFKVATSTNSPKKLGCCQSTFAAIRNDGTVEVWGDYPAANDPFGVITAPSLNGSTNSKLSKSVIATNFIALKQDSSVTAWGQGKYQDTSGHGQSAIPVNLFTGTTPWDASSSGQFRQAAVTHALSENATNSIRALIYQPSVSGLSLPEMIKDRTDTIPISTTELQLLKNVIAMAAGRNTMFAIISDAYGATEGNIIAWGTSLGGLPSGSNWTKIASSQNQTGSTDWSHAGAINSSGGLRLWGVNPYWTDNAAPTGTYKDLIATNTAIIAIRTDNTVAVFSPDSSIQLPPHLQTVEFEALSGGENHVVGIVKTNKAVSTANGTFTVSAKDVIAWGDNSTGQCNIPGYAYEDPNNLPVQSNHIAAGYNYSVYSRQPVGIRVSSVPSGHKSLAFQSDRGPGAVWAEGYMVHSSGTLCSGTLLIDHPFYLNRPYYTLDDRIVSTNDGHKAISSWISNATAVPSEFQPNSTSPKKAKLIFADRLKGHTRINDENFGWSAGYSVFVEDSILTDRIHVFGAEQKLINCDNIITPQYISLRQYPVMPFKLNSIQGHQGYVYALDSEGITHTWGYAYGINYPILSNDSQSQFKKHLSIPKTKHNDNGITYSGPCIAASYVVGFPNSSFSWAVDVSLSRYLNGTRTIVKRFAATGAADKVSIDTGVHFAETFMALDVWPEVATSLDSYYALELKPIGGGIQYRINSASLLALNLDSRMGILGYKVLVEAPAADDVVPDFAIVQQEKVFDGTSATNTGPVQFSEIATSSNGVTLNYATAPTYPSYLRNNYGASARIEFIDPTTQTVFIQGRIAAEDTYISWMEPAYHWSHTGLVTASNLPGQVVTTWSAAIGGTELTPASGSNPTLVSPFTAGTSAVRLVNTSSTPARFVQANSGVERGAFTYFIVKKNPATTPTPNRHSMFVARWQETGSIRLQGIGEISRKPAIIYYDTGASKTYFRNTVAATDSNPQIIATYFGGTGDYGIRVNGADATMTTGVEVTPSSGVGLDQDGYYLGAGNLGNIRDANTEIADILVFNRRLLPDEIQYVEGYLAWTYGLTANLPANHLYKTTRPERRVLSSAAPFNDSDAPLAYIDVGVAAYSASESWLTMYDVHAEYTAPRKDAAGNIRNNHAPIVAELILDQTSTIGFIASTVSSKLNAVATKQLEVDDTAYLDSGRSDTVCNVVNAANTFNVLRGLFLQPVNTSVRLSTSGNLNLEPLQLNAFTVFGSLKFMAGANCEGPYGCTDIIDAPPSLRVIAGSRNLLAEPVLTKMHTYLNSEFNLGSLQAPIRYVLVNAVSSINVNILNLGAVMTSTANCALQIPAPKLLDNNCLVARPNQISVNLSSSVDICDGSGFVIVQAKVTNPSPPLFPINIDTSSFDNFAV